MFFLTEVAAEIAAEIAAGVAVPGQQLQHHARLNDQIQ